LEETDILSRENVAIPTWKDFYTSCFEWARSQKDRSVRLQQILEENQQKEG